MNQRHSPDRLEELAAAECLELLDSAQVGRVAFLADDAPIIVPVNFARDDTDVVIRVADGSALARAQGARVAFEVDDIKSWAQAGRSVVVVGRMSALDDPDRADRLRRRFQPWAGGQRELFLRIAMERTSGRQVPVEPVEVTGQPI